MAQYPKLPARPKPFTPPRVYPPQPRDLAPREQQGYPPLTQGTTREDAALGAQKVRDAKRVEPAPPMPPSLRGLQQVFEGPQQPPAPSAFGGDRAEPNYMSGSARYRNPATIRTRQDIANDTAYDEDLAQTHERDLAEQETANASRDARLDASGKGTSDLMQFLSPLAKEGRTQQFQEGQRKYEAELPGRIKVAEANNPAKESLAPIRPVNYRDAEGTDWTDIVNARGETLLHQQTQLPAGMKRQKTDAEAAMNQIDQIVDAGKQTNWEGTGRAGYGTVQDKLKNWLGIGSKEGATVRAALSGFVTDIIHDKFGTAFTRTEKKQAGTFVPGINDDVDVIESKFLALKNALQTRNAELAAGKRENDLTPLSTLMGLAGQNATPKEATWDLTTKSWR